MKTKLEKTAHVVWIVAVCATLLALAYCIGRDVGHKSKAVNSITDVTPQHTRVIEQCNRINLLSCIACHDFPAYVIDVQPEIWEE